MKILHIHLSHAMFQDLRIAGYIALGLIVGVGIVFFMVLRTLSKITDEEWEEMQKKEI